ncbi:hypothetical protein TNCV_4039131 [Trichonephila clavipes]|nr:hypothetical protein TNCV_4039131 [Trichonephila clavipes]
MESSIPTDLGRVDEKQMISPARGYHKLFRVRPKVTEKPQGQGYLGNFSFVDCYGFEFKTEVQRLEHKRQNLKYDEKDVETCMACDAEDYVFQMLIDDEILTSMQGESDPVDDKMDEDEYNDSNKSSKDPSNANAFSAF